MKVDMVTELQRKRVVEPEALVTRAAYVAVLKLLRKGPAPMHTMTIQRTVVAQVGGAMNTVKATLTDFKAAGFTADQEKPKSGMWSLNERGLSEGIDDIIRKTRKERHRRDQERRVRERLAVLASVPATEALPLKPVKVQDAIETAAEYFTRQDRGHRAKVQVGAKESMVLSSPKTQSRKDLDPRWKILFDMEYPTTLSPKVRALMEPEFMSQFGAIEDAASLLGVDPLSYTPEEIKASHRRMVARHHPDRHQNDPAAVAHMAQVNVALQKLEDHRSLYVAIV